MTSDQHYALGLEMNGMFFDIDRVKIVFIDSTETTAWDREYKGPPLDGACMADVAPLFAEDLVRLIRHTQRPGRTLEIYGLEELQFEWRYSSDFRSPRIDDQAILKRIREELEKTNVALKNLDTNLIVGTIDEYWAGRDWLGEVNDEEIVSRIGHRQWERKEARRNARWMVSREGLRAQFEAGELEVGGWPPKQGDFEWNKAPFWFYRNDPTGMDSDDEVTF